MTSKNILILDCGCKNFGVGGNINHRFTDAAAKFLQDKGHSVEITRVGEGWDIPTEAEKVKKADIIIVQTPGWWMSTPWQFKKYEDEVFVQDGVCGTDGRHHDNPDVNYGRGGILTNKKYMLSSTWNAPKAAFERKEEFFGGVGIDGVFLPVHKAFQFLGMSPLPSFMANDVLKNPKLDEDEERLKQHLEAFIG